MARDIDPNRRIPAEIVFEPIGARIQVTAYDAENRILFQRDDKKTEENAAPRRIKGEVIFEPMGNGVRVTARNESHKLLWGYVASKETVKQVHCLVATYDTLQDMIAEELNRRGLLVPETTDPRDAAKAAIASLEETIAWLKRGLDVKKTSDATLERARAIAGMARDANLQLQREGGTLKGMKAKNEPEGAGDSQ
ncbi:MAG: hypothetical protein FJW38_31610 [Acidobacteria bacterium]|nr:hypothetical protein [Acidobacteriota bacterium]